MIATLSSMRDDATSVILISVIACLVFAILILSWSPVLYNLSLSRHDQERGVAFAKCGSFVRSWLRNASCNPLNRYDERLFPPFHVLERPAAERPQHETLESIVDWLAGPHSKCVFLL